MNNKSNATIRAVLCMTLMCIYALGIMSAHAADEKNSKKSKAKAAATFNCTADPSWFSNPNMPTEVKKSGSDGS